MIRILLIDDDERIARAVAFALEQQGYTVDVVTSASAALEALSRQLPNVIILDVTHGFERGLAFTRRLRAAESTRAIPLILLSGLTDATSRTAGLEAGADDYVTKPVVPVELAAHIATLIKKRQQEQQPEPENAPPA